MTREEILEINPDAIFLPEVYDIAIIGFAERINLEAVVCYSTNMVLALLIEDGMSDEDAEEHFDFNILGSWLGEQTPIFITT